MKMNDEKKAQCPYCLYDIKLSKWLKHTNKCCKQDMRYIKRNPDTI